MKIMFVLLMLLLSSTAQSETIWCRYTDANSEIIFDQKCPVKIDQKSGEMELRFSEKSIAIVDERGAVNGTNGSIISKTVNNKRTYYQIKNPDGGGVIEFEKFSTDGAPMFSPWSKEVYEDGKLGFCSSFYRGKQIYRKACLHLEICETLSEEEGKCWREYRLSDGTRIKPNFIGEEEGIFYVGELNLDPDDSSYWKKWGEKIEKLAQQKLRLTGAVCYPVLDSKKNFCFDEEIAKSDINNKPTELDLNIFSDPIFMGEILYPVDNDDFSEFLKFNVGRLVYINAEAGHATGDIELLMKCNDWGNSIIHKYNLSDDHNFGHPDDKGHIEVVRQNWTAY